MNSLFIILSLNSRAYGMAAIIEIIAFDEAKANANFITSSLCEIRN